MKNIFGLITAAIFLYLRLHESSPPTPAVTNTADPFAPLTQVAQGLAHDLILAMLVSFLLITVFSVLTQRWR